MARLAVYGAISTILAGGVIASAFAQRSNFYAACIYIYRSNACMMTILNLGLFLTIIMGQLVQAIFFGNLRTLEVEHLYERAWYAVTETCLAMTIFKDEFDTRFFVMFTMLLFLKVFHWLCMDRVDSMEQSPEIPLSFHVRMVTIMAMLVSLDVLLVFHAVNVFNFRGPNMMIMFGFEYTLLATSLIASFGKYVLHTIDMRSEEPWENKSMLLFYLDLVADFVKLVTYLFFFMVILVFYGLPLHIIRDVYMTMRSFLQKCKDLIQYRKATRNMNERYPDATHAELAALSDPICIICREEMVGSQPATPAAAAEGAQAGAADPPRPATPRSSGSNTNVPKKLPCGHVFHFHCLKSWLERQQSCPTCRRLVLDPPTPAPTPTLPVAGDAAPAAGAAAVPRLGQQGGAAPGFANFGNNNVQQAPGAHGMGFPMFAPQGHYPLGGWHPQAMQGGPFPGAMPQAGGASAGSGTGEGASTATGASAGTGANAAGLKAHGVTPMTQANYIPHYSIPHVMHPIPGFIPLFPVGGAAGAGHQEGQQQIPLGGANAIPQQGSATNGTQSSMRSSSSAFSSSLSLEQIPLTSLDALTDEQLKYLEENTRRGLQERLRVLQAVEGQIAQSMSALNRVLGALPPEGTPFRSDTADPPSPTMPSMVTTAAGESSSSSASAMDRMFGNGLGDVSGSTTPTSQVGLKPLSRGGLERTLSNGAGQSTEAATSSFVAAENVSGSTPAEATLPSTSPSPSPSVAHTTSIPATLSTNGVTNVTNQLQGSLSNGATTDEGLGVPSEVNGGSVLEHDEDLRQKQQQQHDERVDSKGKGKKSDEELEQESLLAAVATSGQGDEDEEDEDLKYSPQEMVRRRWARINAPLE